jgi:hypothetical protein
MALVIPLRNRKGLVVGSVLIDDEDASLADHRWCQDSTEYAVRTIYLGMVDGKQSQRKVYLHREVMGLTVGDGLDVDHIDGNKSDCRRTNLRVGTHAQNTQNVPSRVGTSKHRGVSWQPRAEGGKWLARGRVDGRPFHVGYFDTEEDAAAAMAEHRREYMPYSNEARSTT